MLSLSKINKYAFAWTAIDTESRHLSDDNSYRDPCPMRQNTCLPQGALSYHCFPPGGWTRLLLMLNIDEHILFAVPHTRDHRNIEQVGKDIKRLSSTTFCGKREPRWDYLAPCSTTSCKLPVMGMLPCPRGGCSSDGLFSLGKKKVFLVSYIFFPAPVFVLVMTACTGSVCGKAAEQLAVTHC